MTAKILPGRSQSVNIPEEVMMILLVGARVFLFAAVVWIVVASIRKSGRIRQDEEEDGQDT